MAERDANVGRAAATESQVVPGASLDDIDWELVKGYLQIARHIRRPEAESYAREDLASLLVQAGCMVYAEGRHRPNFAGLLMFGANPQQFLPSSEIVLARYAGTRMSDEFLRESVRGSLPEQIRRAETFLVSNMRRGSRLLNWKRDEQLEYPPEAVREAVINAVAHRDYGIQGDGIRVIMFTDRLEVYSPGRLPGHVTVKNIVDERFSRNPVIVQVLADLGFIECLGYGIDRMIDLMEEANLPRPHFEETANGFKVTLYGHGDQLLSDRADPTRWAHLHLNERQVRALNYLMENDRLTNRAYQELCPHVSAETIRRDLVELVNRGLLLKIGDKKATYYIFK